MKFGHKSQMPWLHGAALRSDPRFRDLNEQEFSETIEQLVRYKIIETRGTGSDMEIRFNPNHFEWTARLKPTN
jgi:hypothetical protein